MRRAAAIALAALAAAPGAARAQLRGRPMVIPVATSSTAIPATPLAHPFAAPGEADLLLALSGQPASLRPHHALLSPAASPVAQPATFRCVAAGRLAQNGGDALTDVAYCAGLSNQIQIAFGNAPGTLRSYTHAVDTDFPALGFARLYPSASGSGVLVLQVGAGKLQGGEVYAIDFGAGAGAPASVDRAWDASGIAAGTDLQVRTMRISPVARSLGIDDLYVAALGSVTIFPHADPPSAASLAGVRLGPKVRVGGTEADGLDPSTWLPPDVPNGEVLGAAPLDVDLDGDLDLVLTLAPSFASSGGRLLWVERTGDVASLALARPWRDLTFHPDLQPLVAPAFLVPLELGGEPAVALFDRGADAVLMITADRAGGRLRAWRGGAAGRFVRDFALADLVGSPAPDLVGTGTFAGAPAAPAVLVWPDLGDASPELAWAPGGPGVPLRGEDLPLVVSARDPDGPFTVHWLVGDPYGPPAGTAAGAAGAAFQELGWTLPGASLCASPPQALAVTVRATDALGVFDEISLASEVAFPPPALAVVGAIPPGRLALPPGGTTATLQGSAAPACGTVAFAWGGSLFAAGLTVLPLDGPATTVRIFLLPEASYPALLAVADPEATLVATEAGIAGPPAVLAVDLDATGLVEVEHAAGVAGLAPGEVAVVRTTLVSRLGVALPNVRVVDALAGLVPAGAPRVSGAAVAAVSAGGAEIVLAALPPADPAGDSDVVVIELPVRSVGGRGASSVEARSSGGHLLTPPASGAPEDDALPGCACGGGTAGVEALLAIAALLLRSRRARTRR